MQIKRPVHRLLLTVHALPDERQRILQHRFQGLQELGARGSVDDPVIARHGEPHLPPQRQLPLVLDRFRRDPADGQEWTTVPASTSAYQRLEPVYEELPGWQADTTACRSWAELPAPARKYVERLEELAGVPISHVSIGPERDQMIVRSDR